MNGRSGRSPSELSAVDTPNRRADASAPMTGLHAITLGDLLRANGRSHPTRTATVCGEDRATYPQLDERVNRLAWALGGEGVVAGERVLWLGQNCHRVLELLLACAKLGAIFCPANWRQSA